ncbi:phosphotransferase enzyme family [Fusarium sporotrichioides]|uniref:Phosphotransferase enzyme family n=1 Tax=Fusarium sporotrichioides TaxID=5514 RepID=A0A395S5J8_FUSSP|nr:phosphotransferase enzyme family [Fusarium sporotrichioides]
MAASPSSSNSHDDGSDSSSVVYDHEPFETFRSRVLTFALSTIWPDAVAQEITVERLKGGGFNRIIALTRQSVDAQPDKKTDYILRIPRFDAAQVENEVAALQFVHQNTKIPAPTVVTMDGTEGNALSSPYTVQNRIAGVDLYSSFPNLSHNERCRVARELGDIFRQMLDVRSHRAGKLVMPTNDKSLTAHIHVAPWNSTDPKLIAPYSNSLSPEPVHKLLTDIFNARKAEDLERCPTDTVGPNLMDQFTQMAMELDASGYFADQHYSIAHLDLAPRNILVDSTADTNLPIISAVLDWDSAVLAPIFMSCTPPMWIWDWQDDEDEDERAANNTPPTPEGQELKKLFEEAAGQNYCRLAYKPAYRVARRLVQFAINGMRSNEDFKEAKTMLQEWADLYQKGERRASVGEDP